MRALLFVLRGYRSDDGPSRTSNSDLPDDHTLVARIRSGDLALFTHLFRVYAPKLASFVYRYLHTREDAEDIVQELFLRVWKSRETWQVRGTVNDYLYLAARNQARDRLAHWAIINRHVEREAHVLSTEQTNTLDELEEDEHQALIARALSALPERRREICMLRWRDGLSYAEIARQLRVSQKTVENQLGRGLKTLREQLARS